MPIAIIPPPAKSVPLKQSFAENVKALSADPADCMKLEPLYNEGLLTVDDIVNYIKNMPDYDMWGAVADMWSTAFAAHVLSSANLTVDEAASIISSAYLSVDKAASILSALWDLDFDRMKAIVTSPNFTRAVMVEWLEDDPVAAGRATYSESGDTEKISYSYDPATPYISIDWVYASYTNDTEGIIRWAASLSGGCVVITELYTDCLYYTRVLETDAETLYSFGSSTGRVRVIKKLTSSASYIQIRALIPGRSGRVNGRFRLQKALIVLKP